METGSRKDKHSANAQLMRYFSCGQTGHNQLSVRSLDIVYYKGDTLITGLPPQIVTHLLELCLRTTYFKFQGSYYEQTDGGS